jgi:hypothetical protein
MPGIDVNQLWTPARAIPSTQSDQKAPVTNVRGGRYGEQYVLPLISTKHLLADEGSYFIATNPTPGTALAYNVQAAFSDTVPLLYIQNNDSKANPLAKRMYLDYIKADLHGCASQQHRCPVRRQDGPGTARPLHQQHDRDHADLAELGYGRAVGLFDQRAKQRDRVGAVGVLGGGSPGRQCQHGRHSRGWG